MLHSSSSFLSSSPFFPDNQPIISLFPAPCSPVSMHNFCCANSCNKFKPQSQRGIIQNKPQLLNLVLSLASQNPADEISSKSSLTFFLAAAIGSEKAKNGSAILRKPFLNRSSGTLSCSLPSPIILCSSTHTSPATVAVVVAIAGMMRPAICFVYKNDLGIIW